MYAHMKEDIWNLMEHNEPIAQHKPFEISDVSPHSFVLMDTSFLYSQSTTILDQLYFPCGVGPE